MAYTTIDDPSAYFYIKLYNGNGSTQSITNDANAGDFKPDWLWTKSRNDAFDHITRDSSRGVSQRLIPHSTAAEDSASGTTSFDTNGFSLDSTNTVNKATDNYVAWQWKANGGTTSSNTDGSITSTVQANTTAGFSIVTYTGTGSNATVGHGLASTPSIVLVKNRDNGTRSWYMYVQALNDNTKAAKLNSSDVPDTGATFWNSTNPTSSVFSVGSAAEVNENTSGHVAYCFAEKQGYSKFGSYTGNGNADGPMVFCGFKPAWLLIKETGNANDWRLQDAKRSPVNQVDISFESQTSNPETDGGGTFNGFDFLSNGFKVRTSNAGNNRSGGTYIYMAFAEHPFVSSEGVPTTAR